MIDVDCGVSIRAEVACPGWIGSVEFLLNGNTYRTENIAPYSLAGDNNGYYQTLNLSPGNYVLAAIPWSGSNATGSRGVGIDIMLVVYNDGCRNNNNNNKQRQ